MNLGQLITELVRVGTGVSPVQAECNQADAASIFGWAPAYLAGAWTNARTASLNTRPRCS
jgi:hypothetical protein